MKRVMYLYVVLKAYLKIHLDVTAVLMMKEIFRFSKSCNWAYKEGCRYATESEKQEFLEKTKRSWVYFWNVKKENVLKKYVWKPEMSEEYFFLGIDFKVLQ